MGERAKATYSPPPIPEALLNKICAPGTDFTGLEKIALESDSWYKKLKAKERRLLALPMPTKEQKAKAWKRVLSAYWDWLMITYHSHQVKLAIQQVRNQMKARLMQLKHKQTFAQIDRIKVILGNRFSSAMHSNLENKDLVLSVGGKHVDGLTRTLAQGRSALQRATSSSQPPPSESPQQPSETSSTTTSS